MASPTPTKGQSAEVPSYAVPGYPALAQTSPPTYRTYEAPRDIYANQPAYYPACYCNDCLPQQGPDRPSYIPSQFRDEGCTKQRKTQQPKQKDP